MRFNNEDIIVFEDVWKIYRLGIIEYPALRGFSINIKRGEFVAITGPSGSGKSTFLHIAGTLDRPTRGKVLIKGIEVSELTDSELSRMRNVIIGFVFQSFNLINRLTALENVELPLIARGVDKRERRERALESLKTVGLGEKVNNKPTELSGGEQQRVAIARAIVSKPEILLADEPTGNLDSKTARSIVSLLRDINKQFGTTVAVVTHNLEVARYADRIIKIMDGRVESIEVLTHA